MPPYDEKEIDATDSAVKLADEHGIDLATIKGTGADGRITKRDVETAVAAIDEPEPKVNEPELDALEIAPDAMVWVRLVGAPRAVLGETAVIKGETHRVPFYVYERASNGRPGVFAVKLPGTNEFVVEE
ncbi:MAG: hypothetical protein GY803_07280 [Chloroflexi bacterium]|nr:hypothetical protein [Chloroflexota bacterium]